jgi:hypothetical protein
VISHYWALFTELIITPFQHPDLIWGVVPLYFGWILSELTSRKTSFTTAIQTGFTFVWAGAHWTYQYLHVSQVTTKLNVTALFAVNIIVTMAVFLVGLTALISGLRHRYPKYCSFLGHSRFAGYFMIAIFPIQSNYLAWTWNRLAAITLFAMPTWILAQLLFAPLRK